jgi:2-haloacid dehalogenase
MNTAVTLHNDMKPKAILFNLGGVFIDWNPTHLFNRLLPDPEKRAYFLQAVCTNEWNAEQDGGRSLQQGTAVLVAQHPQWQPYIEAYYQQWDEMVAGTIADSVELLQQLRRQLAIELYALTNSSAELFPRPYQKAAKK